jgi:hypothetical protein
MSTQEESLLLSPRSERVKLLNRVVDLCLVTRAVPVTNLLSSDRYFLLFVIRNITFGPHYEYRVKCPSCKSRFNWKLDIPSGLQLKVLTSEDKEPFEVLLPVLGKKVQLRLLRVSDEEEVARYVESKPIAGEGDTGHFYRLSRHIVNVDGVKVDSSAALTMCENMESADSLTIERSVEVHDSGLVLTPSYACPKCGEEFERLMPLTDDFFRPRVIAISRSGRQEPEGGAKAVTEGKVGAGS